MSRFTREEKCRKLEQKPTLKNFFDLLCCNENDAAAYWLEGDEQCSYTYGELRESVMACAAQIMQQQIGSPNSWVGLAVDTCRQWPILFWGLVAAGRNPLLLDPSLEDHQLTHLLNQAGAVALISGSNRPSIFIVQRTPDELLQGEPAKFSSDWADRLAVCTSGTTDTSRVFVYDGNAIAAQVTAIVRDQTAMERITEEKNGPMRTLCFLPLNHIFGFITNMAWTWFIGYPQVFLQDRSPETILTTCRSLKVNFITTVPLLANSIASKLQKRLEKESKMKQMGFKLLSFLSFSAQRLHSEWGLKVAHNLMHGINSQLFGDSLKLIVIGGSHVSEDTLRLINALGYATLCGFGMTEVAVTSAEVMTRHLRNRLSGSVGWPFRMSKYRVIPDGKDPNRGELWIKSEAMHIGRMENGTILPRQLNSEGWYETGDVVRLGERGRMWVVGRTKDVIIGESGENIYPDELEDAFASLTDVDQICVLGTNCADGNEKATLVLSVGWRYPDDKRMQKLYDQVQKLNRPLHALKKIHRIVITPEALPVASRIKVRRIVLREMIEHHTIEFRDLTSNSGQTDTVPTMSENAVRTTSSAPNQAEMENMREEVLECFAEVLETTTDKIAPDAHFIDDLGGDSLQSISLSIKLEEKFDILVPNEAFMACTCVNDVTGLVYGLTHGMMEQRKDDVNKYVVRPILRFEDTPEHKAFQERLEGVDALGGNPYFVCHESPLRDVSLMDGQTVLNFGSYNYVGMSGRAEVNAAAIAAVEKYGTSASGSRLLAGEKKIHQELEQEIADWKGTEDAMVLVGGHSTNVTIVGNFCNEKDLIIYDAISHNSVAEGCRLSPARAKPFPHNNIKALENILRTQRHKFEKVLIIVEGAYSMDGDVAPILEIVELKKRYGCFLMVDEAHSACVLGETGGGVHEYFNLAPNDIDISMGTLSKGLGTCGGYLAGKKVLIDYLRYSLPGFVFSVGISPPLAAASLAAIRLLRSDASIIQDLQRNIRVFLEEAHKRDLDTCLAGETAIVPIMVGGDDEAFALSLELSKRGVFVPPAVYPAVPRGKARLRFCVINEHKPEQIIRALDILLETAKDMGISLPANSKEATQVS